MRSYGMTHALIIIDVQAGSFGPDTPTRPVHVAPTADLLAAGLCRGA